MPYKPPTIHEGSEEYGSRWQRLRAQTLGREPLCRLCLSVGVTSPATVVDHITPLADGGKNETANFQSLCKCCHDSIKTPNDVSRRKKSCESELTIRIAWLGNDVTSGVDFRLFRRHLALTLGFDRAHKMMLAAMDGILSSAHRGEQPPCSVVMVCDDARWGKLAAVRYQREVVIDKGQDLICGDLIKTESSWLRERLGIEYDLRHDKETIGTQHPRAREGGREA